MELIMTVLIVIINVACMYYMYIFNKRGNIEAIINEAVTKAEYTPTVFKIYDKSTTKICNRLIIIAPFDWYVWACRGELYILNPESGIRCSPSSTPAVRVFADHFVETCLQLDFNSIIDVYTRGQIPTMIPYEITETTFTILSALNILMKKWITFDKETDPIVKLNHLPTNDTTTTTTTTATTNNHNRTKRSIDITGRIISKENLVKISQPSSNKKVNYALLHKQYLKHTAKRNAFQNVNTESLDPIDLAYITKRQHLQAYNSDDPKMVLVN